MNGEWPDGWLGRGRDGACEGMRGETECEAAVYLPNKLDRISSIIKEEREMGKTQTYTHIQRHLSVSGRQHASFTHTFPQIMYSVSYLGGSASLFLALCECVCIHVSAYAC